MASNGLVRAYAARVILWCTVALLGYGSLTNLRVMQFCFVSMAIACFLFYRVTELYKLKVQEILGIALLLEHHSPDYFSEAPDRSFDQHSDYLDDECQCSVEDKSIGVEEDSLLCVGKNSVCCSC
ncbi:hypothetical protein TTRE_0000116301 [Trichuris trichiura]|uniref:Uncharacterized protein n=1 Tax=Trichuris trichiura TaxID=36087 RepID=A0A077YYK4_TRITR|nr:hypothetical protein TTRE_0000116301 [Trichuris trichiura]